MIELRLEKVISLIIFVFCIYSCKKEINIKETNEINFLNKDFEQKLYNFIEKSDSLKLKNENKEYILVYLRDILIESIPQEEECAIIFYATEPFSCENYQFGTIIREKKVLFYDDSNCIDFNELISFKSEFECSQFFSGKGYDIGLTGDLYYKYEGGKLLMRDN